MKTLWMILILKIITEEVKGSLKNKHSSLRQNNRSLQIHEDPGITEDLLQIQLLLQKILQKQKMIMKHKTFTKTERRPKLMVMQYVRTQQQLNRDEGIRNQLELNTPFHSGKLGGE